MLALRSLLKWEIGDGNSIDFFEHSWIYDKPIARWPTFVKGDGYGRSLGFYITSDRRWDEGKLKMVVGEELISQILKIPISRSGKDKCVIMKVCSGCSITKLAYLANFDGKDDRFDWLGKVPLPPRIKSFWWRVIRGAVPTLAWLASRGISSSGDCVWGCEKEETLEHLTSKCSKLLAVVNILQSWSFHVPTFDYLGECLEFLGKINRSEVVSKSIFCIMIYYLWLARNDERHGNVVASSFLLASRIVAELPHLHLPLLSEQWCHQQSLRLDCVSSWCTPPPNWVKINFNGALRSNYEGGIGIVIRDNFGKVLRVAGRQLTHWDVGGVELEAFKLLEGLFIEGTFGNDGAIIEGDNVNVIKMLEKSWRLDNWRTCDHLAAVFEHLQQFHSVLFSHVKREKNKVADFCARFALQEGSSFCWDSIPLECKDLSALLAADVGVVDPG